MLFIVPTPIGNLADMTYRAVTTLRDASIILAENTRKSSILLNHYEIDTPMTSFHSFNEHKKLKSVINRLAAGEKIALIAEAGTPSISDTGFLLVREVVKHKLPMTCLPGATALIPAVVLSSFPCDRFTFEGFLPKKKGRKSRLLALSRASTMLVIYESPHRIEKTIKELTELLGPQRQVAMLREISKLNESTFHGTLQELSHYCSTKTLKGEIVLCLKGMPVN